MKSMRRVSGVILLMSSVAACTLPRGSAMRSEIVGTDGAATPSFAHYEVDSKLLPQIVHWRSGVGIARSTPWPVNSGKGAAGQILASGDVVQIAVWENGDNKLLTNPGAPSSQLQPSRVTSGGEVFVPYVGAVRVAGLTPDAARARIQEKVAQMIPAAQVQLEAQPGSQNTVDLVGGVATPGQIPLEDHSLTVLGLIARGGGVQSSLVNPQLRLFRAGKAYDASLQQVLDNPAYDIGLRPGDKLIVQKDQRSFVSLGAAGRQQITYFSKDSINALEAVSQLGGIDPNRANPKGILILREYPASAVRAGGNGGPTNARVVFSINLTTTDGLFSAQNFLIQPGDVVLATESAIVNLRTILTLFNSGANSAYNAERASN